MTDSTLNRAYTSGPAVVTSPATSPATRPVMLEGVSQGFELQDGGAGVMNKPYYPVVVNGKIVMVEKKEEPKSVHAPFVHPAEHRQDRVIRTTGESTPRRFGFIDKIKSWAGQEPVAVRDPDYVCLSGAGLHRIEASLNELQVAMVTYAGRLGNCVTMLEHARSFQKSPGAHGCISYCKVLKKEEENLHATAFVVKQVAKQVGELRHGSPQYNMDTMDCMLYAISTSLLTTLGTYHSKMRDFCGVKYDDLPRSSVAMHSIQPIVPYDARSAMSTNIPYFGDMQTDARVPTEPRGPSHDLRVSAHDTHGSHVYHGPSHDSHGPSQDPRMPAHMQPHNPHDPRMLAHVQPYDPREDPRMLSHGPRMPYQDLRIPTYAQPYDPRYDPRVQLYDSLYDPRAQPYDPRYDPRAQPVPQSMNPTIYHPAGHVHPDRHGQTENEGRTSHTEGPSSGDRVPIQPTDNRADPKQTVNGDAVEATPNNNGSEKRPRTGARSTSADDSDEEGDSNKD